MFTDTFPSSTETVKKAADVWAAGMILYTLFTYKEPFPNSDVKNTIQNITEDGLSKLFENLGSKTLKNLLMDCCKLKDRLTFREIIGKYEKIKHFSNNYKRIGRDRDPNTEHLDQCIDKAQSTK